jgi:hypothetical protein
VSEGKNEKRSAGLPKQDEQGTDAMPSRTTCLPGSALGTPAQQDVDNMNELEVSAQSLYMSGSCTTSSELNGSLFVLLSHRKTLRILLIVSHKAFVVNLAGDDGEQHQPRRAKNRSSSDLIGFIVT